MNETEFAPPSAPLPEPMLVPQPMEVVRRFFRDIDSAGNIEDGMEFHAAGLVLETPIQDGIIATHINVLYLNPFNAKVEKRNREISSVVLYEFPREDAVYWRLWELTKAKLENLQTATG